MDGPDDINPYENIKAPYKVVLVGESGVGKTTLIQRMAKNEFLENIESTVGVLSEKISYSYNGNYVEFQIYDTAGQEKYQSIAKFYLKNTAVSLICFDPQSDNYIESITRWRNIVLDETPEAKFIIVATKYDIWLDKIKVNSIRSKISKLFDHEEIIYVSSLTGQNVDQLLSYMAHKCEDTDIQKSFTESLPLVQSSEIDKKTSCSCV